MEATLKEQTAFRFEPEFLSRMKKRARLQKKSVNRYVTDLIEADLMEAEMFPTAPVSREGLEKIASFSGIMSSPTEDEMASDERLRRIWER